MSALAWVRNIFARKPPMVAWVDSLHAYNAAMKTNNKHLIAKAAKRAVRAKDRAMKVKQ